MRDYYVIMNRHNEPFTAREYGQMLMCLGEARGNASLALRLYVQRHPNDRHPGNSRTITRAYQRVLENVPIVPRQEGAGRPIRARTEQAVLDIVRRNPRLGTRTAAKMLRRNHGLRVSHWAVHKVLRKDRQHPYRIHKVQALIPGDATRRVTYCRWLIDRQRLNRLFISRVVWSDESTFTRNGMWNRRNAHIWARNNPNAFQQTGHQTRWSLNVWAGVYNNQILGPVFLPSRMDGSLYLEFLQQEFQNFMEILRADQDREWEQEGMEDVPLAQFVPWFQHDGAPPHWVTPVRQHLNRNFPNRWIGRYGPREWPPRSPDLTPLDFFLWGYIKEQVYVTECDTAAQMQQRIIDALDQQISDDPTMMPRLHAETLRRAELCVRLGGNHFEPFLIRPERF